MSSQDICKFLQRWNCPYCTKINTAFEKYCVSCNSPRDTGIDLPQLDAFQQPNYSAENGNPFYTPDPELPFANSVPPSDQSDQRESELNNSFIIIDEPPTQTNPTPQESLDGPSVCIPLRPYVYPGEEELFKSMALEMNLPGEEDDWMDELPSRPSAPILESLDCQSEYDYSFMHANEIQQLHSIQEFISNSAPNPAATGIIDSEEMKLLDSEEMRLLDSEEMRFSLTASAKLDAIEKVKQTTNPTRILKSTSDILYPPLDSIAAIEDNWYRDPITAHSSIPVPTPADTKSHSIHPVPYPRTITDTMKQPIPAPRRTSQSSLVTHKTTPEPIEIPDPVRKVNSVRQEKIIDTIAEEKLRVEEIISFLKKQKMDFIDPSFFPSPRSLFLNPQMENKDKLRMITWLRPGQIRTQCRRAKWSVTNHPNPGDIFQGRLGNCWFLSALSVVAEKQKLIDNLLITKEINKHGIYQVCLCMCGKWEVVTIDDSFPCRSDYKTQIYSESARNQLWVCLIEKAAAKLYGCYESLNRGTLIEGLSTLTGAPCETIYFAELLHGRSTDPVEAKKIIWAQITYFKNADFLMGVSTGNNEISEEVYYGVGLSRCHAYSVLNVSEMEGNKLLCLRDPNGSSHWKGDWSYKSPKWTKEMQKMLTPGEGGIFWISLDDLCNYFTAIDVCKVKLDYNEARESAVFPPFLECHTPVYLLELFDHTELDVCLYQPNKRYRQNDKNESVVDIAGQPTDLSVIILKTEDKVEQRKGSSAPNPSELAGFIGRKKEACISSSFKLEPGFYTIVPLAFSHWNTEYIIPYTIATFSSNAHLLESRPTRPGFFAEALFILVKAKGRLKKTEKLSNISSYRFYHNFLGNILIVENMSNFHYNLTIDGSTCHNVVSTRGSTSTQDCIPPRHKQIIHILTYDNLSQDCGISYTEQYSVSTNNSNGGYGSICRPELTNKNRELHSPFYI